MAGDTTCPTCGRDDFGSGTAMKIHHARAHDERLVDLEVCEHCGEEFEPSPNSEGLFCSQACAAAEQRDRVALTCDHCGDEFDVPRCHGDRRRYCSEDCFAAASDTRVRRECDVCERIFRARETLDRQYCCHECLHEKKSDAPRPPRPDILLWLLYVYEDFTIEETYRRQRAVYGAEDCLSHPQVREILTELGVKRSAGDSEYSAILRESDPAEIFDEEIPAANDTSYQQYTLGGGD